MFKYFSSALILGFIISNASAESFKLMSSAIKPNSKFENKYVYQGFGCSGENISPDLAWKNAPKETKSFALLVHDPDAPTGGAGWWHWVAYNIPANVSTLAEGAGSADGNKMPEGSKQVITDFGTPGWGGPCPPVGHGIHHYNFELHALKVEKLEVPANASPSLIGFMVNANSIGKAKITGRYGRK